MPLKSRHTYLDNLKVLLTFLVIAHHASQAYGPTGGSWVYVDSGHSVMWLRNFMAVNASFFMGLFFMISGYFIPRSYKGRRMGAFLLQKMKRLMLPVLFILAVVVPAYFYLAMTFRRDNTFDFFVFYVKTYIGDGLFSYEHGWYMVHLFVYSVVYALVMLLLKNKELPFFRQIKLVHMIGLGALIGGISSVVRLFYPVDTWIDIFGVIGVEPAHLPQYVLLFTFGIIAYRKGYFMSISKRTGLVSLCAGLSMALIIYISQLSLMSGIMSVIWEMWPVYESFMAVFLCIGLLIFFREYCNRSNPLLQTLAHNAFGAYVIHNFFVVLFQISLDRFAFDGGIKFMAVSALSIFCSFGVSFLFTEAIRMIKQFREVNTSS